MKINTIFRTIQNFICISIQTLKDKFLFSKEDIKNSHVTPFSFTYISKQYEIIQTKAFHLIVILCETLSFLNRK